MLLLFCDFVAVAGALLAASGQRLLWVRQTRVTSGPPSATMEHVSVQQLRRWVVGAVG